jgi:mono/diheme cytochrome c family protein
MRYCRVGPCHEAYYVPSRHKRAIHAQVENGKGAMPAWEGTLDDDEIQAVAAYVYDQASGDKW